MKVFKFSEISQQKLIDWLLFGDVGASSKALVTAALGRPTSNYLPDDAGDFARCVQLFEAVPELWKAAGVIIANVPKLAALFAHWPTLSATYRAAPNTPQHDRFVDALMQMYMDGMKADGMIELSPGCWSRPE